MDGTVFTALVSGAVALGTVIVTQALTYFFSKKHDHEADWRKKKLEHYIEYIAAFSRVIGERSQLAQQRHVDALNSLALVAPPNVLTALKALQDGLKSQDFRSDILKWGPVRSELLRAMRKDCHPKPPKDNLDFVFEAYIAELSPAGQEQQGSNIIKSERAKQ